MAKKVWALIHSEPWEGEWLNSVYTTKRRAEIALAAMGLPARTLVEYEIRPYELNKPNGEIEDE